MQTYKVLSLLLQYPDQALMDSLDELLAILIDDALLTKAKINEIQQLIHYFQKKELLLLEENYVNLFDRNPRLSLHLFEHVHGDSRERGQAMVDLLASYEEKGFHIAKKELPDYLPLFLEFLSYLTKNEAAEFLGDTVNILSVLEKRLNGSRSLYGIIFSALLTLTAKKPNRDKVQEALQKESKHKKTLDEAWEETPVDFGPSSSCHSDTGEVVINIDQLKRKR